MTGNLAKKAVLTEERLPRNSLTHSYLIKNKCKASQETFMKAEAHYNGQHPVYLLKKKKKKIVSYFTVIPN